jgi:hypothetical protein
LSTAADILEKLRASKEKFVQTDPSLTALDGWYSGNLRFLCHEAQQVIYDHYYSQWVRDIVILCARRFGKSTLGFILCLEQCLRKPGSITRFIAPEIEQGKMISMTTMQVILRGCPDGLVRQVKSENCWSVGTDSWVFLGGFDSQKDSQRGGAADLIVLDEEGSTNPVNYRYMLKGVLKPQLTTTRGRMVHLGTPPPNLDHPFLTETVAEAEADGRYHCFDIYQNPMFDEDMKREAIKDCGGEDTEDFQREYLCQRVKSQTRSVIPEFSDANVREIERPPHAKWIISLDNGGIRDLTVVGLGYYDFKRAKKVLWDERTFQINTSTEAIALGIAEMLATWEVLPDQWYGDASGQTLIDLYHTHKMNFLLPLKDDVDASINALRIECGSLRWEVHPRCTQTIRTMSFGLWNEKRTDFLRTETLGHNDAIMMLCYMNRMMDTTTNPYPKPVYHRDVQFYRPAVSDDVLLAQAIAPKAFGRFKR